jgi:hypothetical protein
VAYNAALMRRCALLFAVGLACAHPAGFTPADRAAIQQVLRDQQDAWNRGDLAAFLRGYEPSPELVFTSGGAIRRGFA